MTATASNQKTDVGTFQNSIFERLNEFRKQNLFCDVTLDINGKLFPCHRLVLIAASPYFRVMFNGYFKESNSGIIPIKEIDSDIMELLLDAIYTTRMNILPKNSYAILKASHLLQMDILLNKCVEYITNNTSHIHYLIEICLFAKTMGIQNLYNKCILAIVKDVLRWSKTDIFQDLSFDIVKLILSKVNLKSNDDEIFELIIKWCKFNHASSQDARMLLQTPKLSHPVIGSYVMSKLIVSADSSFATDEVYSESPKNEASSSTLLNINVYLNTVDTKTGAVGWGTLKLNDSFDKYTLSNYEPADTNFTKICSSGTKVYCLKREFPSRKFTFSFHEDNNTIKLRSPGLDLEKYEFQCEIIAVQDSIYLCHQGGTGEILCYAPEVGTWQSNVFKQLYKPSALSGYSNWFTLASLDSILYVIGCRINYSCNSEKYIFSFDRRSPTTMNSITFPTPFQHEKAAVCTFNRSLAISGSNQDSILHNTFSIYDLTANKWRTDLKPMNCSRANHKLVHSDGFIYAIENRSIMNEKYDVNLNTWIEISSLPRRLQFVDPNDAQLTIATDTVLYADITPVV